LRVQSLPLPDHFLAQELLFFHSQFKIRGISNNGAFLPIIWTTQPTSRYRFNQVWKTGKLGKDRCTGQPFRRTSRPEPRNGPGLRRWIIEVKLKFVGKPLRRLNFNNLLWKTYPWFMIRSKFSNFQRAGIANPTGLIVDDFPSRNSFRLRIPRYKKQIRHASPQCRAKIIFWTCQGQVGPPVYCFRLPQKGMHTTVVLRSLKLMLAQELTFYSSNAGKHFFPILAHPSITLNIAQGLSISYYTPLFLGLTCFFRLQFAL